MDQKLRKAMNAGKLEGLHSAVVVLTGKLIASSYFSGMDERWGRPLGNVEHGFTTLHDTRSITKSVVSLLYGIALADHDVPDINQPLLDFFPDYQDLRDGSAREQITVRDALIMKMGTKWNEDLPYTNPRNSEIAMEMADGIAPGKTWSYNGGAVAILAKLISEGTGQSIEHFAQQKLFAPLGITEFEWVKGADGVPSAASSLRLTASDLAKIGTMIAQNGQYQNGQYKGQQIVPKDWLEASFQPASTLRNGVQYGVLWYLASGPIGDQIIFALGNGGQRLTIQPRTRFVVSTFTGNYNGPKAWQLSLKVLLEYVIPEASKHRK
ncbi:serine hydrolase domain-containing protein [Cohaesibacter gelatinilyticus]|nr:serine hydrolase [Cohaesibacter gelatinilyticus]